MTPRTAFTIGYQGLEVEQLLGELRSKGVSVLVDTRLHPTSRRPAFRRSALRSALETSGIAYRSEPSLGVPKRIRPLATSRHWLFRAAYEALLRRADSVVSELVRLAQRETIALLCFELEPRECHRLILSETMAAAAPLAFTHLRARRADDADDEPTLPAMVRAK